MRTIAGAIALVLLCAPGIANGGDLTLVALDADTEAPLPGTTVVVEGSRLSGVETAITDARGLATVTLPPGVYQVTFYYADSTRRHSDVVLRDEGVWLVSMIRSDDTIGCIFWSEPPLVELEPSIGYTLERDDLDRIPRAIRGFAPAGASVRIAGFRLPDDAVPPGTALLGEAEIRIAGYGAEHGGATGPIADLAPRSGTNEHHGGVSLRPGTDAAGAAAWASGPVARDHAWYAVAAAPWTTGDARGTSAIADLTFAVTQNHQGRAIALAGTAEHGDATAVTRGVATTWLSRLNDSRTWLEAGAARFETARTSDDRDDRRAARATIGHRFRAAGRHEAAAGLQAATHRRHHPDRKRAFDLRERAAFVRDAWDPTPTVALRAGLRFETSEVTGARGTREHAALLPRLGAAHDWTGEGRSRLFAHWGRYRAPLAPDGLRADPVTRDVTVAGAEHELTYDLAAGAAYERRDGADAVLLTARTRGRHLHGVAIARFGQPDPDTGATASLTLEARSQFDLCFTGDLIAAAGLRPGTDQPSHLALGKQWRGDDLALTLTTELADLTGTPAGRLNLTLDY